MWHAAARPQGADAFLAAARAPTSSLTSTS
jgi:hypothetical protein